MLTSFEKVMAILDTLPIKDPNIDEYIYKRSREMMGFIIETVKETFKCNGNTKVYLAYLDSRGWKTNVIKDLRIDMFGNCSTIMEVDENVREWQKQVVLYFKDPFYKKVALSVKTLLMFTGGRACDLTPKHVEHLEVLKSDGRMRPVLVLDKSKLSVKIVMKLKACNALLPGHLDAAFQDQIPSDLEIELLNLKAIAGTKFAHQYGIEN